MKDNKRVLSRTMGPYSLWAVAVGSIIGAGCFIQGANWTQQAGGPLVLFAGFLLGGLLMALIGYSYSYMIVQCPVAGGEFAYAYKGFGRTTAYVCGWMLSLGYISLVAFNATALPMIASYIFPGVFNKGYMYSVAGYDIYAGEVALSIGFILLFGVINYCGAKLVGNFQLAMVLIMCGAVLLSVVGVFITGNFNAGNLMPLYGNGKSIMSGLATVLAISPYLYVGFDCIPQSAEEYNFPPTKCKKIIVLALVMGAIIYSSMSFVTDCVIPWTDVLSLTDANGDPVGWYTGVVLEMAMGRAGVVLVSVAVTMGILTGINGFYLSSSRLVFGMARAHMLPTSFAQIHPIYRTPHNCIVFISTICCIAPFFGRQVISWVIDMCSVGTAIGYFFTCASAYIVMRNNSNVNRKQIRLHSVATIGGSVVSVVILLLLLVPYSPACMARPSFVALIAWVLMGTVFFIVSKKRSDKLSEQDMDLLILGDMREDEEDGCSYRG